VKPDLKEASTQSGGTARESNPPKGAHLTPAFRRLYDGGSTSPVATETWNTAVEGFAERPRHQKIRQTASSRKDLPNMAASPMPNSGLFEGESAQTPPRNSKVLRPDAMSLKKA
jgi:hypothetical protein